MLLQANSEDELLDDDSVDDEGEASTIAVGRLSICGKDNLPVQPQSVAYNVKPASHGFGEPHTVSVHFVSRKTGLSPDALHELAITRTAHLRLEWSFNSPHPFPKFTTVHLLVKGDGVDVSFGGGLNWAREIFYRFHPPQPLGRDSREIPVRGSCQDNTEHETQPVSPRTEPRTSPLAGNISDLSTVHAGTSSFSLRYQPTPPLSRSGSWVPHQEHSGTSFCHPSGDHPQNIQGPAAIASVARFGYEDESQDDIDQPSTPTSLTMASTRQSSPEREDAAHGIPWAQERPKSQDKLDSLSRQRQEAERIYRETGKTDALFAVLNSAARDSRAWDSSGFPRF